MDLQRLEEILSTGDPWVREWPLVKSYWLPFALTFMYVVFVKLIGPFMMKDRKPFDLRRLMIAYNLFIVVSYTGALIVLLYTLFSTDAVTKVCSPTIISPKDYTFRSAAAGWVIYTLKYLEYADTVFFILRKKYHLVTNLHVIHHAALPLIGWVIFRTEKSGFQFLPSGLNAFVHIVMYSYYALAAMGPEVQKYLWWKEHLTKFQMTQFIIMVLMVFIANHLGCMTTQIGYYMDCFFAVIFFALFFNFYMKTYKVPKKPEKSGATESDRNGHTKNGSAYTKESYSDNEDDGSMFYWKNFISDANIYEGTSRKRN